MSLNPFPSHISSSSSSSSSDSEDVDLTSAIEAHNQSIYVQEAALFQVYTNNNLLMTSYYNQEDNNQLTRRGSIPGHRVINRGRVDADHNLWVDYFTENPRYNDAMFRRRFQMGRNLFFHIVNVVEGHDNYFVQRTDAAGILRLSSLQKITAVFRMLAYGVSADSSDEYIKIGESTAIESMKIFCRTIMEVFGYRYLRSPIADDVERLLHIGKQRGFPEMLGSLDCMHWEWKNCPTVWAGQYSGRSGSPSIILEL